MNNFQAHLAYMLKMSWLLHILKTKTGPLQCIIKLLLNIGRIAVHRLMFSRVCGLISHSVCTTMQLRSKQVKYSSCRDFMLPYVSGSTSLLALHLSGSHHFHCTTATITIYNGEFFYWKFMELSMVYWYYTTQFYQYCKAPFLSNMGSRNNHISRPWRQTA